MNDPIVLPTYPGEDLAGLSPSKLTDILIEDEDRVPRNLIDECARRGDEMTEYLRQLHEDDFLWNLDGDDLEDVADGIWWLRLHAAMILGQIPSEQAGLLLVEFMRRMSLEDDENLQDWLAGFWPALFQNKPDGVLPALRALCKDRSLDWYIRANAIDPVIEYALRQDGTALDQALAWFADIAADEGEDWEYRLSACDTLLDYPRAQHLPLLESMVPRQSGWGIRFDKNDVQRAYAGESPKEKRKHFKNPWKFYEPDAIAKRQVRWREEDEREKQRILNDVADHPKDPYDPYYDNEPYVRPEPKTGRNDPCPCGSGKKYKKCCLAKE